MKVSFFHKPVCVVNPSLRCESFVFVEDFTLTGDDGGKTEADTTGQELKQSE